MMLKNVISHLGLQVLFKPHNIFLGIIKYILDYGRYRAALLKSEADKSNPFQAKISSMFPCLLDYSHNSGIAKGHYFYQDIYVAAQIISRTPAIHLDLGSRVDGFIAHLLAAKQATLIGDIRPLYIQSEYVQHLQIDLMDNFTVKSIQHKYLSISCLHVLEHLGLGRYGDPIDVDGHLKALKNITSLLDPDGRLYISFPISKYSRLEFNAHRVFSKDYAERWFQSIGLSIVDFKCIADDGYFVDEKELSSQLFLENLVYGCGIWTLTKN